MMKSAEKSATKSAAKSAATISFKRSAWSTFGGIATMILVISGTMRSTARAEEALPPTSNFADLETPDFQILSQDKCQSDYFKAKFRDSVTSQAFEQEVTNVDPQAQKAEHGFLDWTPTGALTAPNRPDCDADQLEHLMITAPQVQAEAKAIGGFIHQCGAHLERHGSPSFWALIQMVNIQYPLCENPNIRKVVFRLADGTILRGFLALKPGTEKRPLVLFRCGIFCSSGDATDRTMIMHLFDEGPYNVLTVANMTGADFVRDNGYLAISGMDEGRQMMELGALIRRSPLNRYVSSMHMLGISLGGQGIFYAAQMNDANPWQDGKPLFASALAISSVVNLQSSVDDLFDNPWKGRLARGLFFDELKEVATSIPVLGKLFKNTRVKPSEIPPVVAQQAFLHYAMLSRNWLMKPYQNSHLYDLNEFWSINNFERYLSIPFKTPMLALAADDDIVVDTRHNVGKIAADLGPNPHGNLAALTIPNGNHGAFDMVYGWDISGTLIRTHILRNSPELAKKRTSGYAAFPTQLINWDSRLFDGSETHSQQTFNFKEGRASVKIKFMIFSRDQRNQSCTARDPYTAEPQCYRHAVSEIPFSEIAGASPWAYVPRNATEAAAMTRWANRNLTVLNADGAPISGTDTNPAAFRWIRY